MLFGCLFLRPKNNKGGRNVWNYRTSKVSPPTGDANNSISRGTRCRSDNGDRRNEEALVRVFYNTRSTTKHLRMLCDRQGQQPIRGLEGSEGKSEKHAAT
jgi:hypothetical protein